MIGTKVCSRCREQRTLEAFSQRRSSPDGLEARCRECRAETRTKYTAEEKRAQNLKSLYGISPLEYELLLEKQDNACALCGREADGHRHGVLYVDHDHATERIRGLLCSPCNTALGRLGDSVESIERVLEYLRGY